MFAPDASPQAGRLPTFGRRSGWRTALGTCLVVAVISVGAYLGAGLVPEGPLSDVPPDHGPYRLIAESLPRRFDPHRIGLSLASGRLIAAGVRIPRPGESGRFDPGWLLVTTEFSGDDSLTLMTTDTRLSFHLDTEERLWVFRYLPDRITWAVQCLDATSGQSLSGDWSMLPGLAGSHPAGAVLDADGGLWVAWARSATIDYYRLIDGRLDIQSRCLTWNPQGDAVYRGIACLPDGRVWLALSSGLYRFNPREVAQDDLGRPTLVGDRVPLPGQTTARGSTVFPPRLIRSAITDDGRTCLWLVTALGGLWRYVPSDDYSGSGTWTDFGPALSDYGPVAGVFPTPDGNLWLLCRHRFLWFEPTGGGQGQVVAVPAYGPSSGAGLLLDDLAYSAHFPDSAAGRAAVDADGNLWFLARVASPDPTEHDRWRDREWLFVLDRP